MKSTPTRNTPPAHLDSTAGRLWTAIKVEYGVDDPAGLALLTQALESHQRARQCRESIDALGVLVDGKPHPLLGAERDRQRAFVTTLQALGLDIEPALPVGRQPDTATVRRIK